MKGIYFEEEVVEIKKRECIWEICKEAVLSEFGDSLMWGIRKREEFGMFRRFLIWRIGEW